ncbi:MAG: IS4 family transposase [Chitinophagaceae bacterium]
MLQRKDITNLGELKNLLLRKEKAVDVMVDFISFFEFKTVLRRLDIIKKKGYTPGNLLSILTLLPFLGQTSIYALLKSGYSYLSDAQKDTYYRLKNNPQINWRHILCLFAKRYHKMVSQKEEVSSQEPTCMIIDDTFLAKKGKKIEKVGKVWDHVVHRYLLGFKLLCLGWYDGKNFIPLDFSLHREKGKKIKRPYGLTSKEHKLQFSKPREEKSPSMERIKEIDEKKTDTALRMIKRAVRHKFIPAYILMDSWFSCEKLITGIRGIKKQNIHIVAMLKMGIAKYTVDGKQYTAKQLLSKNKHAKKRCRKLNATYIELKVDYKGIPLKLFFSRYGKKGDWHLVGITNRSLSFIKAMEVYQVRWTIEVFFKEAKQYLGLGSCQSNDLDAHFADITITMMQYILLSLKKRFDAYETKGELFRASQKEILEVTLKERLWLLLIEIVEMLGKLLDIDVVELMNSILNDQSSNQVLRKLFRLEDEGIQSAA